MTPRPSAANTRLSGKLGLSDRIFAGLRSRTLLSTVEAGLARVETELEGEVRSADKLADVTARYLYEAGGKRVRPMLAILTAQLGQGTTKEVVEVATALELTHLGSLYHDDVMDGADKRRGVPSAQTVWGNNIAILTGDLLFARASQLMARRGERAIQLQADTFERLVLGQMHETVGPRRATSPSTSTCRCWPTRPARSSPRPRSRASSTREPPRSSRSPWSSSARRPASPSSCSTT